MKFTILLCILMGCTTNETGDDVDAGTSDGTAACDACSTVDGGDIDAPIAACPVPDTCTGNDICIAGSCVPAYPRTYYVTNIRVTVPALRPGSMQLWDADNSGPDLYVAKNGDNTVRLTPVAPDQLAPVFAGPISYNLTAGASGSFYIDVWDDDGATSQYAIGCFGPTDAIGLRERMFACNATAGMTLTAEINPQ